MCTYFCNDLVLSVPSKIFDSQPSFVFKLILLLKPCCSGLDVTWNLCIVFSKSVLDIKARLAVTVELGTKMNVKFGFYIKFHARIQIFRLLGHTKLYLWVFKITRFFKRYMDFPYENKPGENFP